MLEVLKVIILGIVQGITEWLPISSTGHLILVEQLIQLKQSEAFTNMFNVVIQFGSIMAVVVIYFHKLNPFSPTKTEKQKKMTIQLWIKVVIGTIPALIGGVLLNDLIESKLSNAYVVALMLIVYGILFIIIEKRNETREPKVKRLSQLSVKTVLLIGVFQMMAMIPGTSRSGATIVGALALGVSRGVAAEFTFFLAIPVMFGASALKLFKFGLAFTPGGTGKPDSQALHQSAGYIDGSIQKRGNQPDTSISANGDYSRYGSCHEGIEKCRSGRSAVCLEGGFGDIPRFVFGEQYV